MITQIELCILSLELFNMFGLWLAKVTQGHTNLQISEYISDLWPLISNVCISCVKPTWTQDHDLNYGAPLTFLMIFHWSNQWWYPCTVITQIELCIHRLEEMPTFLRVCWCFLWVLSSSPMAWVWVERTTPTIGHICSWMDCQSSRWCSSPLKRKSCHGDSIGFLVWH